MKSIPGICFVVACSLAGLQAQQRYTFDLDVPAERSSFWRIENLANATRLSAELEILQLRRTRNWSPAFQLRLEAGKQSVAVLFLQER